MTIESLTVFLGWCTLVNWVLLVGWVLMITLARSWVFSLHTALFDITQSQFNAMHYGGIGFYKLMTFMFNLTPYLVLRFLM